MIDFQPLLLTLELAAVTTLVLFLLGVPLAYWLYSSSFRMRSLVEAVITLPLILPPSVLGFYLLLAFTPANKVGQFIESVFGVQLVFTFHGLVLASMIYSLPFMVQPLLAGLRLVPPTLAEASYSLGKGRLVTLFRVLLPNMKASILTAGILTFAHTVGEFGVVLMVGGNLPGETRVVSIAIYDEVEAMNYSNANIYSLILLVSSLLMLLTVYAINHRFQRKPLSL